MISTNPVSVLLTLRMKIAPNPIDLIKNKDRSYVYPFIWQSLLFLVLGLVMIISISLAFGAVPLSGEQITAALLRQGDLINQTIIWDLRLPRTLAALLVGAALGMAGTLLQGMLRNDLADPW